MQLGHSIRTAFCAVLRQPTLNGAALAPIIVQVRAKPVERWTLGRVTLQCVVIGLVCYSACLASNVYRLLGQAA